ncbi:cytochrome P450 [Tropicibacter naphthalenivorans]|uniref:Putative cytochrome P450 120 n=1 Tax=Tropicibacter naphthalenivorans TaxID=441103 RepID=A0A0P1FZS9_9RHOB|nr:cytochrome P450 [Tropicibacter naphthalenivorans]CUH74879.1 Putative cytochrome P450 120 [Tropicibacter naphthalenivorans]SMC48545.1 Cytochrome P450 [Tropicibacter naphthalenivorans]
MSSALAHIPAPKTHPLFGNTLDLLRDSYALHRHCSDTLGEVYRVHVMGRWRVAFASADAMEFILTDPERLFSNQKGWESLQALFPGGLMLRDFDDHRAHRRIMQAAFKKPAMDNYLAMMAPAMARIMADWPRGKPFDFYAAVKVLTLRLGANVFMGLATDNMATGRMNEAFMDEVAATVTLIQKPLPFTRRRRGLDARITLTDYFRQLIAQRRGKGGTDFFSQMCEATDDEGRHWTDQEIVDHFNFLMMAAHDTTASALTTLAEALALNPDWQDRLAREAQALGPLTPDTLGQMTATDRAFREALRLMPPVQIIPRYALRDFEWQGVRVPAGTPVSVQTALVHRNPDYWTNPDVFDPDRFSENRAEDRAHRYAWAPFGGGAHKCIGMHFSTMQAKAFVHALLPHVRITAPKGGAKRWKRMPIPQPKGGLTVQLTAR